MSRKTYSGKFIPRFPEKYKGKVEEIFYRSSWELSFCNFCDLSSGVKFWSSEELVIPYKYSVDGRVHRYFVDFQFETISGDKFWIEIKPQCETIPPKKPKRQSAKYIQDIEKYIKNRDKWYYADLAAKKAGVKFGVLTEHSLKGMGIKLLGK